MKSLALGICGMTLFAGCIDHRDPVGINSTPSARPLFNSAGAPSQITTDPARQWNPAVSDSRVVWLDGRNGTADVYLQDLTTGVEERVVTTASSIFRAPSISGARIVYEDYRDGNWDIFLFDLTSRTERQITTDGSNQGAPSISGNRIVWVDSRHGNGEIYLYDLRTDIEQRITTNAARQMNPAIDGERIVWEDERNGRPDIYLYDLATQTERRLTTDPGWQSFPRVSGDRVVWEDARGGAAGIYLYDLSNDTERMLAGGGSLKIRPDIAGNRIAWLDGRSGSLDIYVHDLSTGVEQKAATDVLQTRPALHDDLLVWEADVIGNADIFAYDISSLLTVAPDETPAGMNVSVTPTDETTGQPAPATITFGTVSTGGTTTVTSGTIGSDSPLKPSEADFKLGNPPTYYDISTTAVFDQATVCIDYSGASYGNESQLKLLHYENGAWVDITTSLDTEKNVVCGITTSFSPFLVAQRNRPPVANAGGPYTELEGSSVSLTGSGADADGDPLTYRWDFNADTQPDAKTASAAHTFTDNGSYTVRLTVSDGYLSHTAEAVVRVDNVAPLVSIASGASLIQGETYTSTGSFTDPGADTWTGTVDYGDGSGSQALPLAGKSFALSRPFSRAGSFTVRAMVTDDDAGSGAGTAAVVVLTYAEASLAIVAMVDELVRAGILTRDEGTALSASYRAAANQFQRDNRTAAANQLNSGLNKVQALVRSGRLSSGNAQPLVDATNRILRLVR